MTGLPSFTRRYRQAFVALAVALLALMMTVAPDFGATWDEPQQRGKALRLLAYLSGHAATLNEPIDGAHLYGAPFDILAAALEPVVPADPYVIRHEVIAVVGWTCILLCGLLADRVFGPPHGLLSMVLLASSPPFFAHAMNNPKDMPFAAVSTAVLLIFWAMASRPPWASPRALVLLALVIGLGLNVRAGALLFIGYLAAVCGYWLMRGPLTLRDVLKATASVASVLAIAVAIGWVGWPWAYQHPLGAPFLAMIELGHFAWPGSVLYDGASYAASALPGDYVPRWLWLTLSPVVLAGLALSSLALARAETRDAAVLLWGATLFPILYVIGTHANLYDGVRHLLFVFPLLFIISTSGWVAAWRSAGRSRPGVVLIATLGLLEPVAFQIRNHPNQTAYIEPLAGGPSYAFAKYDLDYWGNCLLEGLATVDRSTPGDHIYVSGWPLLVLQADLTRFPRLVLVEQDDARATRFVTLARGSRTELLALAAFPGIESRISTADGALLCTVSRAAPTRMTPTVPR